MYNSGLEIHDFKINILLQTLAITYIVSKSIEFVRHFVSEHRFLLLHLVYNH